tara:strand:+ start:917 stop:1114 length:198 start_codon:yes stop_codon:yes gene_type:complete
MDNNTIELLNKKIEELVRSHSEALVSGKSADFASYRELCGVIRGLQTAQREIGDLVRKLKDDDDN